MAMIVTRESLFLHEAGWLCCYGKSLIANQQQLELHRITRPQCGSRDGANHGIPLVAKACRLQPSHFGSEMVRYLCVESLEMDHVKGSNVLSSIAAG